MRLALDFSVCSAVRFATWNTSPNVDCRLSARHQRNGILDARNRDDYCAALGHSSSLDVVVSTDTNSFRISVKTISILHFLSDFMRICAGFSETSEFDGSRNNFSKFEIGGYSQKKRNNSKNELDRKEKKDERSEVRKDEKTETDEEHERDTNIAEQTNERTNNERASEPTNARTNEQKQNRANVSPAISKQTCRAEVTSGFDAAFPNFSAW